MKKFLLLFALLSLGVGTYAKDVVVPKDTIVNIRANKLTQSKRIPHSYTINASVDNNVVIDGVTVFSIGNQAKIHINSYKKARFFGRGGQIVLKNGIVYDNNNTAHKVIFEKTYNGGRDNWFTRCIPFNKGPQAVVTPADELETKISVSYTYHNNKK